MITIRLNRMAVFFMVCAVMISAQAIYAEELLIGMPCRWEDLTSQEQAKARKLGYKEEDTVWKTSNSKGVFNIPGGSQKVTATRLDGKLQLVLNPAGFFELASPARVEKEPPVKITHVIYDGMTQGIKLRCVQQWATLSDADKNAALALGYEEGAEIIRYADGRAQKITIEPPPDSSTR